MTTRERWELRAKIKSVLLDHMAITEVSGKMLNEMVGLSDNLVWSEQVYG